MESSFITISKFWITHWPFVSFPLPPLYFIIYDETSPRISRGSNIICQITNARDNATNHEREMSIMRVEFGAISAPKDNVVHLKHLHFGDG